MSIAVRRSVVAVKKADTRPEGTESPRNGGEKELNHHGMGLAKVARPGACCLGQKCGRVDAGKGKEKMLLSPLIPMKRNAEPPKIRMQPPCLNQPKNSRYKAANAPPLPPKGNSENSG